jgi:hypothetical protein
MGMIAEVHVARIVNAACDPGSPLEVHVDLTNRGSSPCEVVLAETAPAGFAVTTAPPDLHVTLAPEKPARLTWMLRASEREGPALIQGTATVRRGDATAKLAYETPIAVYRRYPIDAPERLIEVQARLVAVTNFHRRNGHLLAIDAARYFVEHLNVPLTDAVKRLIAQEFAFSEVGLPVAAATFDAYKIEDLQHLQFIEDITLEPYGDHPDDPCDEMFDRTYTREYPGVRS